MLQQEEEAKKVFDILSLEQMVNGLKDRQLYKVAKETGISYPTLAFLAKGEDRNYTIHTLYAVSEYLREHQIDKTAKFKY